jgi:hypothetical protein
MATEIDPESEPYQVGDSLIALKMHNQNFEEALVLIELPEGQTVRLGWIPGESERAWTVPIETSGYVTFRIQLTAAGQGVGLDRNERSVVRCRGRMHFSPGVTRNLTIHQPMGDSNFCPGADVSPR